MWRAGGSCHHHHHHHQGLQRPGASVAIVGVRGELPSRDCRLVSHLCGQDVPPRALRALEQQQGDAEPAPAAFDKSQLDERVAEEVQRRAAQKKQTRDNMA